MRVKIKIGIHYFRIIRTRCCQNCPACIACVIDASHIYHLYPREVIVYTSSYHLHGMRLANEHSDRPFATLHMDACGRLTLFKSAINVNSLTPNASESVCRELYSVSGKKETKMFLVISQIKLGRFS